MFVVLTLIVLIKAHKYNRFRQPVLINPTSDDTNKSTPHTTTCSTVVDIIELKTKLQYIMNIHYKNEQQTK